MNNNELFQSWMQIKTLRELEKINEYNEEQKELANRDDNCDYEEEFDEEQDNYDCVYVDDEVEEVEDLPIKVAPIKPKRKSSGRKNKKTVTQSNLKVIVVSFGLGAVSGIIGLIFLVLVF